MTKIKRFLMDEDGAVSVDWVVLCAAAVFLAVFGFKSIRDVTSNFLTDIAAAMASAVVVVF